MRITARQRHGISGLIERDWSPEQIAARARREGTLSISPEWIYRFVYVDRACGGELHRHLRCQRQRRGRIVGRVGIEHRPVSAESRRDVGHWEGDTLIGKGKRGASLTTVERCSRHLRMAKLSRRTTRVVRRQFRRCLGVYADKVKTVTLDYGRMDNMEDDGAERVNLFPTHRRFFLCNDFRQIGTDRCW